MTVGCTCCAWSGWVCEDHQDRPSSILTDGGCDCGGAAVPCTCNPEAAIEMEVIATVDPESVKEWVQ
jgi:hypothetical protein